MILEEFKTLCKFYTKKYKKQGSFRSLKMMKNANGEMEPVFYVGVPGMMVALTITLVTIATVYLLYLPFMWYVWVPYVILLVFIFRIALKLDKVRQIRYMVFYMLDMSLKMMERADEQTDDTEKKLFQQKALNWLEKADKWVDEPTIKNQMEQLR